MYGRDSLTRDALLHGHLQEGSLPVATCDLASVCRLRSTPSHVWQPQNQEKRLASLRRRQWFQRTPITDRALVGDRESSRKNRVPMDRPPPWLGPRPDTGPQGHRFKCNRPGHYARDCRAQGREGGGWGTSAGAKATLPM